MQMNSFLYESSFFFLLSCMQEISPLLSMEAMAFVTEDRKAAQESTFPNTYTFDLFGGVDVSVVYLVCFAVFWGFFWLLIFFFSQRFLRNSCTTDTSVNKVFGTSLKAICNMILLY